MPGTAVKTHKPEPATASPARMAPLRGMGKAPVAQGREPFATRQAQAQARQANTTAWQQAKATPASQPRQTSSLPKVGTLAAASARVGASAQPAPVKAAAAPSPAAAAVLSLLQGLPKWVLRPVTEAAHEFTGYRLLTVLLGFDPFTGQPVLRTAKNLADGLLNLSDAGQELNRALVKSGVLTRAGNVIEAGAGRHQLNAARLDALLTQLGQRYHDHSWAAMYHNPDLLLHPLKALATDVWAFLKEVAPPLLDLLIEASGQRGKDVLAMLRKGQATYAKIMADPVAFLHNLLDGVLLGFTQFKNRALEHLGGSFTHWLFGGLAGNIRLKLPFTAEKLFLLGLDVLDLSYDKLRDKLVKRLGKRGEQVVGILEEAGKLVYKLVHEGPGAVGKDLLAMAQDKLTGFKDQVLASLRTWLMQSLVVKGLEKLAAYLTPATALLESLHQIYTSVVFFLERADKFTRLLSTIVDAFADIANRNLKPAADKVETTLASLLDLALDWFMRLLGLGNMPKVVAEKVKMARQWVDELVEKLLDKLIEWGQKLWRKGKQAATNAVGAVKGWLGIHESFPVADGTTHELYFRTRGGQAELVRASDNPQEISDFLATDAAKADATKHKDATDLVTEINLITRTATAINQVKPGTNAANTTPDREAKLVPLIQKLATLLYGMVTISKVPDTDWKDKGTAQYRGSGDKQWQKIRYLKHPVKKGTPTPKNAAAMSFEYQHIKELNDGKPAADRLHWVQMHLISDKVGGLGVGHNLVPAPNEVNTGGSVLYSFEKSAQALLAKDPSPVLWMDVEVKEYHKATETDSTGRKLYGFAKTISFEYGLMLPPPKEDGPWRKSESPLSHQIVNIPTLRDGNIYLNQTTKTKLLASQLPILKEDYGPALMRMLVEGSRESPYTDVNSVKVWMLSKMANSTLPALKKDAINEKDGRIKPGPILEKLLNQLDATTVMKNTKQFYFDPS